MVVYMLTRIAASISMAWVVASCGASDMPRLSEASTPGKQPFFVVMGGYQSCGDALDAAAKKEQRPSPLNMRLYPPFQTLLTKLKTDFGVTAEYIVSCFTLEGSRVFYAKSSAPTVVLQADPFEFHKIVEEAVIAEPGSPRLTLVGHSHGGWLGMKLAEQMRSEVVIDRIETLDPISYVNCNRTNIIEWRTRNPNPQCLRSPEDMNQEVQQRIHDRVINWTTGHQDQSRYLHSSEISKSHDNYKTEFEINSVFGINAHTDFADHPDIWGGISDRVTGDVKSMLGR
jgi:hypothetical protein